MKKLKVLMRPLTALTVLPGLLAHTTLPGLLALLLLLPLTARAYTSIDTVLIGSAVYPGTRHSVRVTLPDGYEATARPDTVAMYLGLDGVLCNAPAVFDRLHSKGRIPLTVGIFLQPGFVAGADGTVVRWNRSNEFDATDTLFATFLDSELLPFVRSLRTSSGRKVTYSSNPARRAIFGLSSGGIAAFTAAWHRPDLFGKVFTGCATLVPMRGGHNLQAIVRKHEPKPLKIMIQDTYHDTWNPLFGSWYEANRQMAGALKFSGYDLRTDWTEGVHSLSGANRIFMPVMEWLFAAGTNDSIAAGVTANNFLQPLLDGAGAWEAVTPETAAAVPESARTAPLRQALWPDSTVMARADTASNFLTQYLVDKDGNPYAGQRYYWLHTYDNALLPVGGMAFDGGGNLWAVTGAGLQICDQNGRVRGILSLPAGLDVSRTGLVLLPGAAVLLDASGLPVWQRCLNLTAPVPGRRPRSQGAA